MTVMTMMMGMRTNIDDTWVTLIMTSMIMVKTMTMTTTTTTTMTEQKAKEGIEKNRSKTKMRATRKART